MPQSIIEELKAKYNLKNKIVGVLGLAFKAENDDIRDSLAIKLVKKLKLNRVKTLQSDEYYSNKKNVSKNNLIRKSDIIIIAAPHKAYKNIKITPLEKLMLHKIYRAQNLIITFISCRT